MPDVAKHAHTHRPRSEGGTDPIPSSGGFTPTWATVTQFSESITKASGYYRPRFKYLATNDTGIFGNSAVSSSRFNYLTISEGGYYIAHFGVVTDAGSDIWGAFDTELQFVYNDGGDVQFNTGVQLPDFTNSDYSRTQWQHEDDSFTDPLAYRGLWQTYTFHYDPDNPNSDFDFTAPLGVGVTILSAKTANTGLTAQVHVHRIAEPGFTEFDAAD
jgi:hypothetical protein